MYEQYLISKNQVYLYGILIAGVVGIIVYIYNTITKKENRLTGSIKTFGILAVALIIFDYSVVQQFSLLIMTLWFMTKL